MKTRLALLCTVLVAFGASPVLAEIEMYGAMYGGVVIPHDFSDTKGRGVDAGIEFSDLKLKTSQMLGGKVGFYSSRIKWLGAEAEFNWSNPHLKQQNTTATLGGASGILPVTGKHLRVLTGAFNVLARYPGERVQPYAGVGLAIVNARLSGGEPGDRNDSVIAPGLNALVGVKGFLTENLALFGEYKFTRAELSFNTEGIDTILSTSAIVGGVSYHF